MNNTIDSATSELEIAKTLPNNILVGVEAISLCAPETVDVEPIDGDLLFLTDQSWRTEIATGVK